MTEHRLLIDMCRGVDMIRSNTHKTIAKAASSSNFELKRTFRNLSRNKPRVERSLAELEASRVEKQAPTASKYGLEAICGASCETGAQ